MSHSGVDVNQRSIDLMVLDIDGTLTGPDDRVSEKNASAVRRLQYHGTPVTLATGRSERSTSHIARALGVRMPIITYNGGKIVSPTSGTALMERRMLWQDVLEVCRVFQASESHATLFIYTDIAILGLTPAPANEDLLLTQDDGVLLNMRTVQEVEAYAAKRPDASPLKMMVGGQPVELQQLTMLGRNRLGPDLAVVESGANYVEILPAGSTKGSALEWLASHLGIPTGRIAAMGNAPNDVEMLRLAGVAIAVSDAHPDVLRVASLRAPASGEDAVAAAIDRLFPGHNQPPLSTASA